METRTADNFMCRNYKLLSRITHINLLHVHKPIVLQEKAMDIYIATEGKMTILQLPIHTSASWI